MACGVDEIRIHKWPIQPLEYAPWGDARPYDGGFRYNCMMLKVRFPSHAWHCEGVAALLVVACSSVVYIQLTLEDSGSQRAKSLGFSVNDDTCEVNVD